MEDLQLLDAIERYVRNEMGPEERAAFERLRQHNPEVDQLVVEHSIFLQQIDQFGETKHLKATLHEVHHQLTETGEIREKAPKATILQVRKYRRVMAVAASIAGITTLLLASIATYYNSQARKKDLEELGRQFKQEVNQKTNDILNKVDTRIPKSPENANPISGGTGFLIDGRGFLVTNAHVVKSSKSVIVQNNRNQEFHASIIYIDQAADLAVLEIQDEDYKPLNTLPYTIRKNNAELGEPLFTLGYPRDEIVYNEGYMSAKTGFQGDTLSFQIGVSANPGNSGAPVFNRNGEVIGIINTRQVKAEGVVFAISAKNIFRSLEEIRKDTAFQHIRIPVSPTLKGMDRVQQIRKIEDCVFMVKSY